jgi:hypothetical protein
VNMFKEVRSIKAHYVLHYLYIFFSVHAFIVVDSSCNSSPIKLPYNYN